MHARRGRAASGLGAVLAGVLLAGAGCGGGSSSSGGGPGARVPGFGGSTAQTPAPPTTTTREGGRITYSGTGDDLSLGDITVTRPSTLTWTVSGPLFNLGDENRVGRSLYIDSQAPRGSVKLAPATYQRVHVIADGPWTVKLAPDRPSGG